MGCCGNKRKEWLNSLVRPDKKDHTPPETITGTKDKSSRVFEYTGEGTLSINGVASGKHYYFKGKGERLSVDYGDSFALMAEPGLKIVVTA